MIKYQVCSLKTPNNTSVFKNKDPGNILDKGILIIYTLDIFPPGRKKIRSSECKRGRKEERGRRKEEGGRRKEEGGRRKEELGRGIKNQRTFILFSY